MELGPKVWSLAPAHSQLLAWEASRASLKGSLAVQACCAVLPQACACSLLLCSTAAGSCALQGSEARRLAVLELGEEIAAQLRQRSVLPTSVLLAAAMEAAAVRAAAGTPLLSAAASFPTIKPAAAALVGTQPSSSSCAVGKASCASSLPNGSGVCCSGSCANDNSCASGAEGGSKPAASGCVAAGTGVALVAAAGSSGMAARCSVAGSGASPGVVLEALQPALEWVAGELELRGASVVRPGSAE